MFSGEFIQGGVQLPGFKRLTDFDFLPTVPPMGIMLVKDSLLSGISRRGLFG